MIVGVSVEGRPIEAIDVAGSRRAGGVGALVFGAIHGDEPGSAELCRRFLDALAPTPPLLSHDRHRRAQSRRARTRKRKNNARDVDLNRNFAARNWQRAHAPGYDPGPTPQSEPETAALAALIDALAAARARRRASAVSLRQLGRRRRRGSPTMMAAACGYPSVAIVGYPTPGSFGSRYGVDEGRCVVTLELPRPVPDGDWDGCLRALRCCTIFPPAG